MTAAAKPRLRGVLHQWAVGVALAAGAWLVWTAPTTRAAVAAAVYIGSLVTLLTVSATYHRVTWQPAARAWMRRLDHASIFVLIAGTYTPVALLGLPAAIGDRLTVIVWSGAALGVVMSVAWVRAPKVLTAGLCIALGWTLVPYLGELRRALTDAEVWLIVGGGVAYTTGAVAYAAKRPTLRPEVFGYHELFHTLTLVAAALHFTAVASIVARV